VQQELLAAQAARQNAEAERDMAVGDAEMLAQAFDFYKADVEGALSAAREQYQQGLIEAQSAREKAEAELNALLAAQAEREALEARRIAEEQETLRLAQETESLKQAEAQQAQRLADEAAAAEAAALREAQEKARLAEEVDRPARILLEKAEQLRKAKAYALALPLYEQCARAAKNPDIFKAAALRKLDCCVGMADNDAIVLRAREILDTWTIPLTDAERSKVQLVLNMTLAKM
jgi:hypothetical protein